MEDQDRDGGSEAVSSWSKFGKDCYVVENHKLSLIVGDLGHC